MDVVERDWVAARRRVALRWETTTGSAVMTESAGGTNAVPAAVEVVVVVVVVVVTAPASGLVATVVVSVFLQAAALKTSAPARTAMGTRFEFPVSHFKHLLRSAR